jgi:hypothetical protein
MAIEGSMDKEILTLQRYYDEGLPSRGFRSLPFGLGPMGVEKLVVISR